MPLTLRPSPPPRPPSTPHVTPSPLPISMDLTGSHSGSQLKRFRNMGGVGRKASDPISFPLSGLDLRPHYAAAQSGQSCEYELFALVAHHGNSLSSGHYTAFVRGLDPSRPQQWYHKDDAKTTAVAEEEVLRAEAYLLFYCRSASAEHAQLCDATLQELRAQRGGGHVTLGISPAADSRGARPPCLVSRGWLARLLCCEEPVPLGLEDVLCCHQQARSAPLPAGCLLPSLSAGRLLCHPLLYGAGGREALCLGVARPGSRGGACGRVLRVDAPRTVARAQLALPRGRARRLAARAVGAAGMRGVCGGGGA